MRGVSEGGLDLLSRKRVGSQWAGDQVRGAPIRTPAAGSALGAAAAARPPRIAPTIVHAAPPAWDCSRRSLSALQAPPAPAAMRCPLPPRCMTDQLQSPQPLPPSITVP